MTCCVELRTLSWTTLKRKCCRSFQSTSPCRSKMVSAQSSGQCVQPTTDQRWNLKKGQQFTLLKRITSYKSVNSESIEGSILSHRVPSWGSCHLVDSTWVTHLNWNNFSNFVVECIGRDNDPKKQNLTRREFSGRRDSSTDAQYSCGRCSSPP